MKTKKHRKRLRKAFGLVKGHEVIDYPPKISGTQISRLLYGNRLGCSWCFPHGWEVVNSTLDNNQRNWKRFRKTQWK